MTSMIWNKARTAIAWRPFVNSFADWAILCLLHLAGRGRASWKRVAVPVHASKDSSPLYLRVGTSDFVTFREVFIEEEYRIARTHIDGEIRGVLDLGANIGLASRWLLRLWPQATITAVEPSVDNCRILERNLNAVAGCRGFCIVNAFVGGRPRQAVLASRGDGFENEGVLVEAYEGQPATPVVTVADLSPRQGVSADLVKIDIESSELELFTSDTSWTNAFHWMLIELHAPLDETWLLSRLDGWHVVACERRHANACLALLRNTRFSDNAAAS